MISIGTRAHGATRRRAINVRGDTFHKSEWMESGDDPVLSPTVFLVEQPANTTLVPHFHRQNQFQLFVDGGGLLGKHPVQTVTVHYAGAYTGYGPLVSGEQGIKYFTIRPVCESGMLAIEDSRDQMIRGPKRHESVGPIEVMSAEAVRAAPAQGEPEHLLPLADDGLGVDVLCRGAGAPVSVTRHAASQGIFLVVLSGTLAIGNQTLNAWESVFVSGADAWPAVQAGPDGVQCVALHCPPKDPAYR